MNGRRNKYVSRNFLYFTATSEPSMQNVCMGGTKGGNSGTFRFPTETWSPAFERIAEQAANLRPEGSLQCPVNFVMGRPYGTDGTWEHREHTDGRATRFPDTRYSDATPVFSVGTATAAVSVTVSLVPCCSKLDDDPFVTLSFPETNATDAHVWCLFSDQLDQGALRIRHKVKVLKSVKHSSLPRIALVFRSVPAFSGGTAWDCITSASTTGCMRPCVCSCSAQQLPLLLTWKLALWVLSNCLDFVPSSCTQMCLGGQFCLRIDSCLSLSLHLLVATKSRESSCPLNLSCSSTLVTTQATRAYHSVPLWWANSGWCHLCCWTSPNGRPSQQERSRVQARKQIVFGTRICWFQL